MRADITYNDSGLKPHSRRGDEWLAKAFAAIDGDLTPAQVETIAGMAREAGLSVRLSSWRKDT